MYQPVIYAVNDPEPLATLSSVAWHPYLDPCLAPQARQRSREARGYRNSCTFKRGSFGMESQTGQLYYVAGSDDFRAYGWAIPSIDELVEARTTVPLESWVQDDYLGHDAVWFCDAAGQTTSRPCELSHPSFTLEGKAKSTNLQARSPLSILHSVILYVVYLTQTLPMIATAGIERLVRLHYAVPTSEDHSRLDYDDTRPATRSRSRTINASAMLRALARRDIPSSDSESQEDIHDGAGAVSPAHGVMPPEHESTLSAAALADEETIALFDELLREEEGQVLFPRQSGLADSETDSSDTASLSSLDQSVLESSSLEAWLASPEDAPP